VQGAGTPGTLGSLAMVKLSLTDPNGVPCTDLKFIFQIRIHEVACLESFIIKKSKNVPNIFVFFFMHREIPFIFLHCI
jgi:hypothetical protein